eukprot:scaffold12643_cov22-Prasinocladus_malaysianus.AAC.1
MASVKSGKMLEFLAVRRQLGLPAAQRQHKSHDRKSDKVRKFLQATAHDTTRQLHRFKHGKANKQHDDAPCNNCMPTIFIHCCLSEVNHEHALWFGKA